MRDLANRVPDDGVHHTVDAHALPDGRVRIGDNTFSAKEFADMLRRDPNFDGSKPVRLLSCDAGTSGLARDLANELGTPVTAPRGLAWTDGNGRVFASDMGPDGRPGWPPNGGWDTHNPDGTTTPASNDGFHPTRDGEDPGQRPEDAESRGKRSREDDGDGESRNPRHRPRGEPVDSETPGTEANKRWPTARERADNDPDYRHRYYDRPGPDGVCHLRQTGVTDNAGEPVPALYQHSDGHYSAPPTGIDNYATWDNLSSPTPSRDQLATYDQLVEERRTKLDQLANAKRDDAQYAEQKDQNGTVTKPRDDSDAANASAERLSAAHAAVGEVGERFGETAARDSLINDYGVSPDKITVLHHSGVFDLIGELPDGRFVVVEAKGPNAGLGSRMDLNGERSQQGTKPYFDSIAQNMAQSPDPQQKLLAARLKIAMADDISTQNDTPLPPRKIRYDEVKPVVETTRDDNGTSERSGGYTRKRFNLGTGHDADLRADQS